MSGEFDSEAILDSQLVDLPNPAGASGPDSGNLGSEFPEDTSPKSKTPVPVDHSGRARVRNIDSDGIIVYKRSKRLKSNSEPAEGAVNSVVSWGEKQIAKVEVKEDSTVGVVGDVDGNLEHKVVVEALVSSCCYEASSEKRNFEINGRPTTVKELFDTGLLEGYPVFYNGGKKGALLRGMIKEFGILCTCALCKGTRVIPLCQFEIHATQSYKRASQYICLENGKSLLDIVKECRKGSLRNLEETIQNCIGPALVKQTIICQKCQGSFLGRAAANFDRLCDECITYIRPRAGPASTKLTARSPELTSAVHSTIRSPVRISLRRKRKFTTSNLPETDVLPDSAGSASMNDSSTSLEVKSEGKITSVRNSLTSVKAKAFGKITKVNNSATSVRVKTQGKILKRLSKSESDQNLSKNASPGVSAKPKSQWKITKKDQNMHKLVFEEGGLPDGTEVAYYSRGKKLLLGYKQGLGIFCSCCKAEVSPSQFEAHAGWATKRKPYNYIYTSNGVSLHEFALSLLKGGKNSGRVSDDLCIICADGGKLILCDGCPRAFHKECASLPSTPRGKWFCKYCQNMFQREKSGEWNANAVAAGRVSGINAIEQITKRCIRIVKNPEAAEVIACVICRGYDFSTSGFGPRTVILCDQCEREYHVGCLKNHKMADLKELPRGNWFCTSECKRIFSTLQNLLTTGEEKLSEVCLGTLKKEQKEKSRDTNADVDVRWRLLSGKITSRETRVLLSEAVGIFHDCFNPIVDATTGRDFIPSMVYGRNIRGQDFGGMYCAVLTVNSCVVSAGILRIFGQNIAELPLVATRIGYQDKGYFKLLFSCIEKLLSFLKVKTFVLPAADEAVSIWTNKFGFRKISPEQLKDYRKACWQMISFKGTAMLEKTVPRCRIIR